MQGASTFSVDFILTSNISLLSSSNDLTSLKILSAYLECCILDPPPIPFLPLTLHLLASSKMFRIAISTPSKSSKSAISKCKFSTTPHNLQSPIVYKPKIPKVVLSEEEKQKLKEENERLKEDLRGERKWKGGGNFIPLPIPVSGWVSGGGGGDGKDVEGEGSGADGGGSGGGGGDEGRGVETGSSDPGGFDWTDWIPDPTDLIG